MQSGAKNPPWARSNVSSGMSGMNPQIMDHNSVSMNQQGMMPFQQTQAVFNSGMMQAQGGMGMPMGGQMQMNQIAQGQMYPGNVVAYPTPRAINNAMYQNSQVNQAQAGSNEQRVFTGTVTKTHNDFGFVDHDVFYQTSVCAKGVIPKLNDRVLVEATYNPNMPFKWNATRVQVLPKGNPNQQKGNPNQQNKLMKTNQYNAVPPPQAKKMNQNRGDNRPMDRGDRPRREDRKRSVSRPKSRSPLRRESRNRRDSPPRKRQNTHAPSPVKYTAVRVPRIPLDIASLDVPALSQRYTNMYIPSDFFSLQVRWVEAFPPQTPLSLNNPCSYHIMSKEAPALEPNDAVLEPPDADYRFSAKVLLISLPSLETLYQKCGLTKSDDKDAKRKSPLHPTRLIKFLVGQKGKAGENFAIGGPWSPSLDGENPQSDPSVLVKTAIRSCKALTGIDLSSCTQWYRVVEFYYWRESGGRTRLETVVLYVPDVWSAQARCDWTARRALYREHGERLAAADPAATPATPASAPAAAATPATPAAAAADVVIEDNNTDETLDPSTITIEENDDDDKPEPTHYSKLELKTMKVDQLRKELRARNASSKGLRTQLLNRLKKLLTAEENKDKSGDVMEILDDDDAKPAAAPETEAADQKPKEDGKEAKDAADKPAPKDGEAAETKIKSEKDLEEEKKKTEKAKAALKAMYELPTTPHTVVHPSATARGGKFSCTVATLSLMLDYRVTDNKEHSFELFVFAELFNEMLMRDFGFYIYKTLATLPEKVVEPKKDVSDKKDDKADKKDDKSDKKDEKSDKKDDKSDKKEEKSDKKEEKSDKKDDKSEKSDKKDDKRDSRRRDRRDSRSDDERSASPRHRGGGVDLPPDPYLLLSLVYFDTARGGAVGRRELQNLFMSLGLRLSRAQMRPVLDRLCIKDMFVYKPLIQSIRDMSEGKGEALADLPLDTSPDAMIPAVVPPEITELEETLAKGNRELLPVFKAECGGEGGVADASLGGMVTYKARLVDVGATLTALSRSEKQITRLEAALAEARGVARTMRAAAAKTQAAASATQAQLADQAAELLGAKNRIACLTASSKIFHSALKTIQTKVEAVVNIKFEGEDGDANGPAEPPTDSEVKYETKDNEDTIKKEIKLEEGDKKETVTGTETKQKDSADDQGENMDLDDK